MEPPNPFETTDMSSSETLNSTLTPEKLSLMKLRNAEYFNSRDFLSAPSSPTGRRKSFDFGNHASSGEFGKSSSVARATRAISTRRSSSFRQSHGGLKVSSEITRQAEGKFFALMDLVSSASREAASLKEIWSGLISERESLTREREELMETITEVTETLERKENEQHNHHHEHGERKKQIEKLLVELSVALNTISEYEKKNTTRDHELLHSRNELQNLRDTISRSSITHDKLRSEFEDIELRIRIVEEERDHAKIDVEKYQNESRTSARELTEFKSKFIETTSKLETSRKEIISLMDRLKSSESERDDYLVEKDRMHELLRKANFRNEETSLELFELTEKYEHQSKDVHKSKEKVRDLEEDVDKFTTTIEHLRRELKTKSSSFDEAEARASEFSLKHDHLKRENLSLKEKLTTLELERSEQQDIIERSREESRVALLETNSLRDEMEMWRHRTGDHQRLINTLQETLRKNESTLVEVRSEVHTLTDRLHIAERERNDARDKHGHHTGEITGLKEKLFLLQAELRTITESRDRLSEELHQTKLQYEEITETMSEFRDSSGGYEFEIENLRTMLRDSREQKERAITARNAADRERDEYISRYEEKCRELERFEQNASSQFRSLARSSEGGRNFSSSRIVSRSNTSNTLGTIIHHNGDRQSYESRGGEVQQMENSGSMEQ
jgi:chromosome segregation ATPase